MCSSDTIILSKDVEAAKIDADRLQAFHVRCLYVKSSVLSGMITNDTVRATTGVEDIESRIRRR